MNSSFVANRSVLAVILSVSACSLPRLNADTPTSSPNAIYSCDFAADPIHSDDPTLRWWTNNPALVTWVQDTIHSGKGSLKLANTDKSKNVAVYGPFIPYTGPMIKTAVELKEDSVDGSGNNKAVVGVYYYDSDKKPLGMPWPNYHDLQQLPNGSADWATTETTFNFPSASPPPAFVRVVVNLVGTGTIWVDKAILSTGP